MYEYIDNGNLEQWLHGDVGPVSPLTWDIRMKIAIGTAKGCSFFCFLLLLFDPHSCCHWPCKKPCLLMNRLAYLHEGLEPKVVHRDVKSSNILLDRKWNAKVSDFGLAKLLGSETSYVTTRVMGTFGYTFFVLSVIRHRLLFHIDFLTLFFENSADMFHRNMQARVCSMSVVMFTVSVFCSWR